MMDDDSSGRLPALQPIMASNLLDEPLLIIRGQPVLLAATVARVFGVTTREINQAAKRNPHKFGDNHCFPLNQAELDFLISQTVISKSGRGGSRAMPIVYNQKGVARLATILDSPAALHATDQMIDLSIQVHRQLAAGQSEVRIAHPDRYVLSDDALKQIHQIRKGLYEAVVQLMKVELDPQTKTTLGDEIGTVAASALGMLKAHLNAKSIENDKLQAETLLVLERVREIRDRTAADVRKSHAETEGIILANIEKRLTIVERLIALSKSMAPDEFAVINRSFSQSQIVLRVPPLLDHDPDQDDE